MTEILKYIPPSGEELTNPSLDFLRKVIFDYDPIYWLKNSGDSALIIEDNGPLKSKMLIFFYDEPYGFFAYYEGVYVSVKKNTPLKDENVIKHKVGGEPMGVPSICYRTKVEMWEILIDFIDRQKMCEKYTWVELSQIDYNWDPWKDTV